MVTCKNCAHRFDGNFCNACGQSAHTHRINFHYVVHEIQHGIVHVDRGFFFTIKELFTRPGNSIREYIEGKRVDHFKPLAFLLVLSTIYAFLSHTLHNSSFVESALTGFKAGSSPEKSDTSLVTVDWLLTHYAYTSLLTIPITSLASYLSFIKSKYNYWQHLVLNAFVAGQITLFHIVYLFITYSLNQNNLEYLLDYVELGIGFLLTLWTYLQFFTDRPAWQTIFLTLVSYLLFTVFIGLCLTALYLLSKL